MRQIKKLGVAEGFANLSASFGTSIGQNGCAGIYTAMVAGIISSKMMKEFNIETYNSQDVEAAA